MFLFHGDAAGTRLRFELQDDLFLELSDDELWHLASSLNCAINDSIPSAGGKGSFRLPRFQLKRSPIRFKLPPRSAVVSPK